jgi:acyl dehydratase
LSGDGTASSGTVQVKTLADVEFGEELPEFHPAIDMATVKRFTDATGMSWSRFNDHEEAKKQGLPGAIVPGIMSQGILTAMVNNWAPGCSVVKIDTIFRAALVVDSTATCRGVVTDIDEETATVEIDLTISNEANETRVLGTALVELHKADRERG